MCWVSRGTCELQSSGRLLAPPNLVQSPTPRSYLLPPIILSCNSTAPGLALFPYGRLLFVSRSSGSVAPGPVGLSNLKAVDASLSQPPLLTIAQITNFFFHGVAPVISMRMERCSVPAAPIACSVFRE